MTMYPLFLFILFSLQVGTNLEIRRKVLDYPSLKADYISNIRKTERSETAKLTGTVLTSQFMNITLNAVRDGIQLWAKLVKAQDSNWIFGFYKYFCEELLALLQCLLKSLPTLDINCMMICISSFWNHISDLWEKFVKAWKEMIDFKEVDWTSPEITFLLTNTVLILGNTSANMYELMKSYMQD